MTDRASRGAHGPEVNARRISPRLALSFVFMVTVSAGLMPGAWADAVTVAPAFLPLDARAEAAIEALPMVHAASARAEESRARGDALAASPYGFEATIAPQVRFDHVAEAAWNEWEASLSRRLRLPGKAALDRALGAAGVEAATLAVDDARHMGARLLLERWFAWLRAALATRVAQAQLATVQAEQVAIGKRVSGGDLAILDGDRAAAQTARAELAVRQRRLERDQARLALVGLFPAIELPPDLPTIPSPEAALPDVDAAVAKAVARSHEIAIALALAERQQLNAARVQSNERPDPSVGLRVLDESRHDQQALAVVISLPFASAANRASAVAEGHLAAALAAEADGVRQEVAINARQLAEAVAARLEAWQAARTALAATRDALARVERAFALGEAGYADVALARRELQDAEYVEIAARLDAHETRLRLAVDSHDLWARHFHEDVHGHGEHAETLKEPR
ncbi:MAG: TolC family protein [Gammaproteobacteria bacterium]